MHEAVHNSKFNGVGTKKGYCSGGTRARFCVKKKNWHCACSCPVCTQTTHLVEIRIGFRFTHSVKVLHINQLVVKCHTRIGDLEFRQFLHMRQVPQMFVAPVVQVAQAAGQQGRHNNHLPFQVAADNRLTTHRLPLALLPARLTNLARARPCASRSTVGTPSRTNRVNRDCSMLEYFWKAMFLITGGNWWWSPIMIQRFSLL